MVAQLSSKMIIPRQRLAAVADGRLADANVLVNAGRHAAAVYIGGYAVECCLKAAICKTLDLDDLPGTFAVHDLELLLLHSGLNKQIQLDAHVHEAFNKLREVWDETVRYDDPGKYTESEARSVINWVTEVVGWVKRKTN